MAMILALSDVVRLANSDRALPHMDLCYPCRDAIIEQVESVCRPLAMGEK